MQANNTHTYTHTHRLSLTGAHFVLFESNHWQQTGSNDLCTQTWCRGRVFICWGSWKYSHVSVDAKVTLRSTHTQTHTHIHTMFTVEEKLKIGWQAEKRLKCRPNKQRNAHQLKSSNTYNIPSSGTAANCSVRGESLCAGTCAAR